MNKAARSMAEHGSSSGGPVDIINIDADEVYLNDLFTRNWPTLSRWFAIASAAPKGTSVHIQVRNGVETVTLLAPLVEHAIDYASRGWHVFPLKLREKVSH